MKKINIDKWFTHSGLQHGQHYYPTASSNAHAGDHGHLRSSSPLVCGCWALTMEIPTWYQPILIIFVTLLFVERWKQVPLEYKTPIYTPADTSNIPEPLLVITGIMNQKLINAYFELITSVGSHCDMAKFLLRGKTTDTTWSAISLMLQINLETVIKTRFGTWPIQFLDPRSKIGR